MALNIKHFPDIRASVGPSYRIEHAVLQPAAADYISGGYLVTADNVELGKLVGADIVGTNSAGANYNASFVFPAASLTTAVPPAPAASVLLKVTQSAGAAGPLAEVAAGTDLSGVTWLARFIGW